MSVSQMAPDIIFATYLQAKLNHEYAGCHGHWTQPRPRTLPLSQAMTIQQSASTTNLCVPDLSTTLHRQATPRLFTTTPFMRYYRSPQQNTINPPPDKKYDELLPTSQRANPTPLSFRSLTSTYQDCTSNTMPTTLKVDNSPEVLPPTVLPYDVDTSKYENVPMEDWLTARVECDDASSPSSAHTEAIGPITPESQEDLFSDWSANSFFNQSFTTPFGSVTDYAFNGASSTANHLPPTGLYATNGQPNNLYHGLPSQTHTFNKLLEPFDFSTALNRNTEPASVSPKDIEQPTSLQSSFTTDETVSSPAYSNGESEGSPEDYEDHEVRQQRDEFLLEMRNKGHSYKEIKRLGKFTEAESTLRGRVRVLTKEKSQRVRKPKWEAQDV